MKFVGWFGLEETARRTANSMPENEKHARPPSQGPLWLMRATTRAIGSLFDWIGRHELSVLLAMTGVAIAVLAFIRIADAVGEGKTARFDQWAVRAMRQSDSPSEPIGPHWLGLVARDVTARLEKQRLAERSERVGDQ